MYDKQELERSLKYHEKELKARQSEAMKGYNNEIPIEIHKKSIKKIKRLLRGE